MPKRITSGVPASAKLIEKQLRKWELTRDITGLPPSPHAEPVRDFVCISRSPGIDDAVAEKVAEALDWPLFSRKILESMAGDDPVRRRLYEYMDQRDLTWWDETVLSLVDDGFIHNDYFRKLCETVLSLARKGNAVFVGRGADLILPRSHGFRVGLTASWAARVQAVAGRQGMDPKDAERRLHQTQHKRGEFLRHHFGVDAEDPLRHDLMVNLDRWSEDEAARLILDARRLRVPAKGAAGSRRPLVVS